MSTLTFLAEMTFISFIFVAYGVKLTFGRIPLKCSPAFNSTCLLYTSMVQLSVMYLLAAKFSQLKGTLSENEVRSFCGKLMEIPDLLETVLEQADNCQYFASKFQNARDLFFIGRGVDYSLSLEGSLKLKEISVDFKVKLYGKIALKKSEPQQQTNALKGATSGQRPPQETGYLGYIPGLGRRDSSDNYAQISLKFESEDPPEGLMRISDQLTKVTL